MKAFFVGHIGKVFPIVLLFAAGAPAVALGETKAPQKLSLTTQSLIMCDLYDGRIEGAEKLELDEKQDRLFQKICHPDPKELQDLQKQNTLNLDSPAGPWEPAYDLFRETPSGTRDWKALGKDTKYIFAVSVAGIGALYMAPKTFSHWNEPPTADNYISHIKHDPVWDKDSQAINYIGHPYFGAGYYMRARMRGFNIAESFAYSVLLSTAGWEYGAEALFEIPSVSDIVITPTVGALLGELFFRAREKIRKNNFAVLGSKKVGKTLYLLMDPYATLGAGIDQGQAPQRRFIPQPYVTLKREKVPFQPADGRPNSTTKFGIGFRVGW